MERIREVIRNCIDSLRKAPIKPSRRTNILLNELYDFLRENPEMAEKTLPILLSVYDCVKQGKFVEAFGQLLLLLILIRVKRSKK